MPSSPTVHFVRNNSALLAAALILTCSALAAALPPIPSVACTVVAAHDAPKLDGALDESGWQTAELQSGFHRYYGRLAMSRASRRTGIVSGDSPLRPPGAAAD